MQQCAQFVVKMFYSQFSAYHIFSQSFNLLNYSIKLSRNAYIHMKNELKLPFYLKYVNSKHKSSFTSHFHHSISNLGVWSSGVVFPLKLHQLISGDLVEFSLHHKDQVGANPKLFNFIPSFFDSEHFFTHFRALGV